jgi:hypothetical protein
MTWRAGKTGVGSAAALLLAALGMACTGDRAPQPPFLCCVLTCTGGLVRANKTAPERVDAGWGCERGQPIDYNGSCSAEDTSECEDPGASSQGMGSGAESGSSGSSSNSSSVTNSSS